MGSIQIFTLNFSGTRFACARTFDGVYRLQAGDYTVTVGPGGASALAQGGATIRTKAKVAAFFRREMKAGRTFARDLLAVDGRVAHVEFGVSDAGDVYLEIGTGRMTLTDQQADLLLSVLDQLGSDITAVYRATAVPMDINMVPALRGWRWPWEVDPEW